MPEAESQAPYRRRPTEYSVWDIHAHFVPQSVVEAAEARRFGMRIEGERLVAPAGAIPLAKLTDLHALLQWMDARSIWGTVLSIPPLLYRYDLEKRAAVAWTRVINDGLRAVCREAPDRVRTLAHLPLQVPELAVEEVENDASGPHSGFSIGSSVG